MPEVIRLVLWGVVYAAACAVPVAAQSVADVATDYPAEAAGDGLTTNGYNPSRWAEDWRIYRDPAKRDDALDRLKYLPLDPNGPDSTPYLTLSGEVRARMNLTSNPGLEDAKAQRQDILRVVVGADLHLGDHARIYGELAHGGIGGENLGVVPGTLRNALFAQQLFGEATGRLAGIDVGVRGGRQEFTDGITLLISTRDNNTVRFVLDGVRAWAKGRTVRADLFDFHFVTNGTRGLSDDPTDRATRFSGINLGFVVPTTAFGDSKLYFDPFVWRLRSNDQSWGGVTAREVRTYRGMRLWGDIGRWSIDYTLTREGGDFGGRPIDAWQVFLAQTYRLGTGGTAPRIGVRGDYGSGGGTGGSGTLHAAYSPYGNNVYYSYGVLLGPINYLDLAPTLAVSPLKTLRLTAEYAFVWRATTRDAVYRSNGQPYDGTQNVGGRSVAQLARLQILWAIAPRLSFTARLEHVGAGDALTRAGYRDTAFGTGWFSFRF